MWSYVCVLLLAASFVAGAAADHYHSGAEASAWRRGGRGGAARAREEELSAEYWRASAQAELAALEAAAVGAAGSETAARHVILFVGDGMSVPTLAAARTLLGQRAGRLGEDDHLSFETFPTVGLSKTYCVDAQIPDSACTATAFLCGVKTNQGLLGLTANVTRYDCAASLHAGNHISSITAWALEDGRDVGIVTTTRITHATPAGAYAHAANRNWESDTDVRNGGHDPTLCPDIAHQLVHSYPANQFKVILGGGLQKFTSSQTQDVFGTQGSRSDGRDLVAEWVSDKNARNVTHAVVNNAAALAAAEESGAEFVFGMFASDHQQYWLEAPSTQPSLAAQTAAAVRILARNPRGSFLLVEGGRIDHAHHDVYPMLALDETIQLAEAVAVAQELSDPSDTLIVVTSDHSHVMAFNGYTARGSDILGKSDSTDSAGVPYMTLSYTNGPGFRAHVDGARPDVTQDTDFGEARWRAHVDAPLSSETHGGDDVGVFAWGAGHSAFAGLYEQHALPHRMAWAACLGDGRTRCTTLAATATGSGSATLAASAVLLLTTAAAALRVIL